MRFTLGSRMISPEIASDFAFARSAARPLVRAERPPTLDFPSILPFRRVQTHYRFIWILVE